MSLLRVPFSGLPCPWHPVQRQSLTSVHSAWRGIDKVTEEEGAEIHSKKMQAYRCLKNIHIPPPLRQRRSRQRKSEKDDQGADHESDIQPGGGDVVKLLPPGCPAAPDPPVEHQADKGPGREVERRRGREPGHGAQHDGGVQVPRHRVGESARCEVEDDREESAEEPKEVDLFVHGTGAKKLLRADNAPDYARRKESAAVGAGEIARLVGPADARDVAECPVLAP